MKKSPISFTWPRCLRSALVPAAALSLIAAGSAPATVTLSFSSATTYATNWANGSGVGGSTLVWGLLIDTSGNGFEQFYSSSGVTFTGGTGQSLKVGTGDSGGGALTDDFLFLSPFLMNIVVASGPDGSVAGLNRITTIVNIPYGTAGIDAGDAFRLVWFDRTVLSGSPNFLERFGFFGDASFTIGPDSTTTQYLTPFIGADPLKPMNTHFDVTPEPSAALLSLLGALGLLRRRR